MDKRLLLFSAIMLFGVFISSVAQVMLKKAAQKTYDSFWKEYINPRVMTAYAIFFGATLLSVYGYKLVPLFLGAILDATEYIYITIFGVLIFKEKLSRRKIMALLLIISGIVVYSLFG